MRFTILKLLLTFCFLSIASMDARAEETLMTPPNRRVVVKKKTPAAAFAKDRIGYVLYEAYFRRPAGMSCEEFEEKVDQELFLGSDDFDLGFVAESDVCYDHSTEILANMFVTDYADTTSSELQGYITKNQGRVVFSGSKLNYWKETSYLFPSRYALLQKGENCGGCVGDIAAATLWTQTPHYSDMKKLYGKGRNVVNLTDRSQFLTYIEDVFGVEKKENFDKMLNETDSIDFTVRPRVLLENGKVLQYPFGDYAEKTCYPRGVCF